MPQKTTQGGQKWFIQKLATLIPSKSKRKNIEGGGLCYGIALMWIQALLVGDVESFNKRMAILSKFESAAQMKAVINKIKNSKLKGEVISSDEELVLSIPVFLMGVLIHAKLVDFAELLFPEIENIPSQFGKLSFAYTQPVGLKGGVYFANLEPSDSSIATFSGVYTKAEIILYFSSLTKILTEPPVTYSIGIELGTSNHSIAVGYDHKTKKWTVTDANELPPKTVDSFEKIADLILLAETFQPYKGKTSFASAVYVEGTNQKEIDERLQRWRGTQEWKQIHEITDEKALFYNREEKISFIQTAIRARDTKLVLALLEKIKAPQLEEFLESGLLVDAIDQGLTEVVTYLLDRGAARDIPNKKNIKPLEMALERKGLGIAKLLLEYKCDEQMRVTLLSAVDGRGYTALHLAAESNFEEGVKLMLSHGLQANVSNNSGGTPFLLW